MMRETGNGGNIINISSISGIVGIPGNVAYSAAKAGGKAYDKAVARNAKENIRVNSIHPGLIDTICLPAQNRKMLKMGYVCPSYSNGSIGRAGRCRKLRIVSCE